MMSEKYILRQRFYICSRMTTISIVMNIFVARLTYYMHFTNSSF